MTISFNQVPQNIRVPFVAVEFSNERANQGLTAQPYTSLLIGQKLTAGTATSNLAVRVTSDEEAIRLFGAGSMLAEMVKAYRAIDTFTSLYCLPLEDSAAGAQATGTITVAGVPEEAGTLCLYINGTRITVGVAPEAVIADVAASIATAINAKGVPVTATSELGIVTLKAKWKGTTGNNIDIRLNYFSGERTPRGLTITLTPMDGGSGDPEIAEAIALLDETHYNIIALAYNDGANLLAIKDEMERRWGPMDQRDGVVFFSTRGTMTDLATIGRSQNHQCLSFIHAAKTPTSPWALASATAACAAYYGNIDPARPFQTLPLSGVLAPAKDDRFTLQERNLLLYDGVSTWTVDAGNMVRLERLITTYRQNPAGADDPSYLDVTTILTLGRLKYSLRNWLLQRYPRHKLASGDLSRFGRGQAIATPDSIKADIVSWYSHCMDQGLVENMDLFIKETFVERDSQDVNRVNILLAPDVINQLIVMAAKMEFRL